MIVPFSSSHCFTLLTLLKDFQTQSIINKLRQFGARLVTSHKKDSAGIQKKDLAGIQKKDSAGIQKKDSAGTQKKDSAGIQYM